VVFGPPPRVRNLIYKELVDSLLIGQESIISVL